MLRDLKSPETCFQAAFRSWHLHLPFAFSAIIVAGELAEIECADSKKAPSRDHFQDGAFLLWIRANIAAAGSVMLMLQLGEILEEWTHKRPVADLASAMSLRVDSVWRQVSGAEVLTKITDVKPGDRIVIRAARALI